MIQSQSKNSDLLRSILNSCKNTWMKFYRFSNRCVMETKLSRTGTSKLLSIQVKIVINSSKMVGWVDSRKAFRRKTITLSIHCRIFRVKCKNRLWNGALTFVHVFLLVFGQIGVLQRDWVGTVGEASVLQVCQYHEKSANKVYALTSWQPWSLGIRWLRVFALFTWSFRNPWKLKVRVPWMYS